MARPPLSPGVIQPHAIQTAAGVSLEIAHNPFRRNLRLHHRVHVIASHMGRDQDPTAMRAHIANCSHYDVATDLVEVIGRLVHTAPLGYRTR